MATEAASTRSTTCASSAVGPDAPVRRGRRLFASPPGGQRAAGRIRVAVPRGGPPGMRCRRGERSGRHDPGPMPPLRPHPASRGAGRRHAQESGCSACTARRTITREAATAKSPGDEQPVGDRSAVLRRAATGRAAGPPRLPGDASPLQESRSWPDAPPHRAVASFSITSRAETRARRRACARDVRRAGAGAARPAAARVSGRWLSAVPGGPQAAGKAPSSAAGDEVEERVPDVGHRQRIAAGRCVGAEEDRAIRRPVG